jgi:hypothetical protein
MPGGLGSWGQEKKMQKLITEKRWMVEGKLCGHDLEGS